MILSETGGDSVSPRRFAQNLRGVLFVGCGWSPKVWLAAEARLATR